MAIGAPLIAAAATLGSGLFGAYSSAKLDGANRYWSGYNRYRSESMMLGRHQVKKTGTKYGQYDNWQVYGGKGADLLGRDRDLKYGAKNYKQAFALGKEQGLTPQEISGSPVPGGTSSSGGNAVLGNSLAKASAAHQAAVSQSSSDRMRANTSLQVAGIQAASNIATAKIAAGQSEKSSIRQAGNVRDQTSASRHATDTGRKNILSQLALKKQINDVQIQKIRADTKTVLQDAQIKRVIHSERWEKLFSSMSADNVMASVFAVKSGVDIKSVLQGAPDNDREALQKFISQTLSSKSRINIETEGIVKVFIDAFNKIFGP